MAEDDDGASGSPSMKFYITPQKRRELGQRASAGLEKTQRFPRLRCVVRSLGKDLDGEPNDARRYLGNIANAALANSLWGKEAHDERVKKNASITNAIFSGKIYERSVVKKQREQAQAAAMKINMEKLSKYGATKDAFNLFFSGVKNKNYVDTANVEGWIKKLEDEYNRQHGGGGKAYIKGLLPNYQEHTKKNEQKRER